jgi:hypothetical protein
MFNGVSFFGIIHQSGGCGPELLGAIDLLQSRGVPVRCILPTGDPTVHGDRAKYLASRGVEVLEYTPGLFASCSLLMSFGEKQCFDYMRDNSDRPEYVVWSNCMSWAVDREATAHSEGLIDEFFFQTERNAEVVSRQIQARTNKPVFYRPGYFAFINKHSDYAQYDKWVSKDSGEFRVSKAVRDDPDKWHELHWRMCSSIVAPPQKKLQFDVIGWGENAKRKIGDPCSSDSVWSNRFNLSWRSHVVSPEEVAKFYGGSHVLLHFYPFYENYPRASLQAMLAKAVVIAEPKGGFLDQIRHGETGFFASTPEEAAYYTSKLAFEWALWQKMSDAAVRWVMEEGPGNPEKCWPWWELLLKGRGIL